MSIWCSGETIGYEDESLLTGVIEGGEVREPQSHWAGNGVVLSYAHGWSNHYPDGTAEHPASIDLATIPPWCVPDHRDEDDWSTVGPWLRLSVDSPLAVTMWEKDADGNPAPHPESATVVLDEEAAETLRDLLSAWLERPKVRPTTEPPA